MIYFVSFKETPNKSHIHADTPVVPEAPEALVKESRNLVLVDFKVFKQIQFILVNNSRNKKLNYTT